MSCSTWPPTHVLQTAGRLGTTSRPLQPGSTPSTAVCSPHTAPKFQANAVVFATMAAASAALSQQPRAAELAATATDPESTYELRSQGQVVEVVEMLTQGGFVDLALSVAEKHPDVEDVFLCIVQRLANNGDLAEVEAALGGLPSDHFHRIAVRTTAVAAADAQYRDTASVTVLTARPRRRRRVLLSFRKSFSGQDSSRASPGSLQTSRPSPLQGNQNSMHPPPDKPCPKWIVWPPCRPAPRQDRLCGGTSAWCCGGRWWLWSARRSPSPSRRPGAKSSSVSRHRCRRT